MKAENRVFLLEMAGKKEVEWSDGTSPGLEKQERE
jgi:hypothetical protein